MTTVKLQMPELAVGQAGKELTHNQAINIIDQMTQTVVISRTTTTAPGSPANGDLYLVPDSGVSGVWAGNQGNFAFWLTSIGVWTYVTPRDGWSIYVADALAVYRRLAGSWVISEPVTGAASSVDNDIARFNGTSGKSLKAGLKYQSSPTDSTSGSLLINSAYGLGSIAGAAAVNLDGTIDDRTGWYLHTSGMANFTPPPGITGGMVQHNLRTSSGTIGQAFQVHMNISSTLPQLFMRSAANSTYSPWAESWSSLGANAITADTGSVGYGVGSGGTVIQAASKATGVTLNKPSGQITMNGASLASATAVSFTLTNSKIAGNDVPAIVIKSGATAGAYTLTIDAVAAGSCRVSLRNHTAGALAEALVLQFNVGKGAIA